MTPAAVRAVARVPHGHHHPHPLEGGSVMTKFNVGDRVLVPGVVERVDPNASGPFPCTHAVRFTDDVHEQVVWFGAAALRPAAEPGTILHAWQQIARLVGREDTSPASVVDRVAYLIAPPPGQAPCGCVWHGPDLALVCAEHHREDVRDAEREDTAPDDPGHAITTETWTEHRLTATDSEGGARRLAVRRRGGDVMERCPEVNETFERRCECEAGHDGWHGFAWADGDGANWWPGKATT